MNPLSLRERARERGYYTGSFLIDPLTPTLSLGRGGS